MGRIRDVWAKYPMGSQDALRMGSPLRTPPLLKQISGGYLFEEETESEKYAKIAASHSFVRSEKFLRGEILIDEECPRESGKSISTFGVRPVSKMQEQKNKRKTALKKKT